MLSKYRILLLCLPLVACGTDPVPASDAATSDAATSDAATNDAATNDAATNDAATNDAATSDAATSDAATLTPNGGACVGAGECGSGHCADGVCCDTSCDGICSACNRAATGEADGVCSPVTVGTDPSNDCAESACGTASCDGAGACGVHPNTTACRAAQGPCDTAEMCDGTSTTCAEDARTAAGTVCRAVAGTCDTAELCDGMAVECPVDSVQPNTLACSAEYECDGSAATCPTSCTTDFDCVGDRSCIQSQCVPGIRVFISSTTTDGNMGGLAGADVFCQNAATAAGLKGSYKAWLSDSTQSPSTRFARSTVPYYMMNGIMVAMSYADLLDGMFNSIPYVSELGMPVAMNVPFTGTSPTGTPLLPDMPQQSNCAGWTSNSAAHHAYCGSAWNIPGDPTWTQSANSGSPRQCNVLHRLYCFAQPTVVNN